MHHDVLAAPSKSAPFVTADAIRRRVTRAGGRQQGEERGESSDCGSGRGAAPQPTRCRAGEVAAVPPAPPAQWGSVQQGADPSSPYTRKDQLGF